MKLLTQGAGHCVTRVRPHTGAWIETVKIGMRSVRHTKVRPHTGAWIETVQGYKSASLLPVRPHTGAWIETVFWPASAGWPRGSPPHGGVD